MSSDGFRGDYETASAAWNSHARASLATIPAQPMPSPADSPMVLRWHDHHTSPMARLEPIDASQKLAIYPFTVEFQPFLLNNQEHLRAAQLKVIAREVIEYDTTNESLLSVIGSLREMGATALGASVTKIQPSTGDSVANVWAKRFFVENGFGAGLLDTESGRVHVARLLSPTALWPAITASLKYVNLPGTINDPLFHSVGADLAKFLSTLLQSAQTSGHAQAGSKRTFAWDERARDLFFGDEPLSRFMLAGNNDGRPSIKASNNPLLDEVDRNAVSVLALPGVYQQLAFFNTYADGQLIEIGRFLTTENVTSETQTYHRIY